MTTNQTDTSGIEFAHIDPAILDIADNVRDTVELDATYEFVESIRTHGVLHPILAVRRTDQTLAVVDGQRRTLAARSAGLTTIPAIIREQELASTSADTTRIVEQIVSNDQRVALSDGQRARGVAQLLDLGLTISDTATALSTTQKAIKTAGRVGGSTAARAAVDTGQLDLEQASVIAAFEALGDENAVAELLQVAEHRPHQFGHTARRLQDNRKFERDRAKALAAETKKGHPILEQDPETGEIEWLYSVDVDTTDGEPVDVTEDPDRWHAWADRREAYLDSKTGEEIDQESIDGDTIDDPERAAAEGLRHINSVDDGYVWDISYWITPDAATEHGYRTPVPTTPPVAAETTTEGGTDTSEANRVAAERAEAEKIERRRVKALNTAGTAETGVRREFLKTLLGRKTLPKGAAAWTAARLARDGAVLTEGKAGEVAKEVLPGIDALHGVEALADKASEARAQVLVLALVLIGLEARLAGSTKSWWRSEPQTRWTRDGFARGARGYLDFLVLHGYTAGPVERIVLGEHSAEEAEAEITADTADD